MSKRYTAEQKAVYATKMRAQRTMAAKRAGGNRNVRVSRQVRLETRKLHIEDCSQEYIVSLLNPYDSYSACIPNFFPLKSQKVHAFSRATMTLGTSGVGYALAYANAANDVANLVVTTATSVGTTASALNGFTNLASTPMAKLPYAQLAFTQNQVMARLVSAGLRIKYIGRSDALNGLISTLEAPDHEDLAALTPVQIADYDQMENTRPKEDGWTYVNYSGPIAPGNLEFANTGYILGANGILSHIVVGTAGDEYTVEFYQNFEYIGSSAVGKSQNHSDPVGYSKVSQVIKSAASDKPLSPADGPGLISQFATAMGKTIADNAPSVIAGGLRSAGETVLGIVNMDPSSILRQAFAGLQAQHRGGSLGRLQSGGSQRFLGM